MHVDQIPVECLNHCFNHTNTSRLTTLHCLQNGQPKKMHRFQASRFFPINHVFFISKKGIVLAAFLFFAFCTILSADGRKNQLKHVFCLGITGRKNCENCVLCGQNQVLKKQWACNWPKKRRGCCCTSASIHKGAIVLHTWCCSQIWNIDIFWN